MSILSTHIEYLKGVGRERAALLSKELNIKTFEDLIHYFPFRYVDKSKETNTTTLKENVGNNVLIRGILSQYKYTGFGNRKRLEASLVTHDNQHIQLMWFKGGEWIKKTLHIGQAYICFGKLVIYNRTFQISHPEMNDYKIWSKKNKKWQAVYSVTENLRHKNISTKTIEKLQENLATKLKEYKIEENLPLHITEQMKLMNRAESLFHIHHPASNEHLKNAIRRIKFEEVFWFQLRLAYHRFASNKISKGPLFQHIGSFFNAFYKQLNFELTHAQKKVLKEIRADCKTGQAMNRLLQGDVGSGKTVVALMSMLIAIDNGFQACLVAPTEVLAQQHYQSICKDCFGLPLHIALLTGNTTKAQRIVILRQLAEGTIHILVGTHAVFEDSVYFKKLGLAIIDEQHRFGVEQRAKLVKKNQLNCHALIMTATPIPRTLAMTAYSDLSYSLIDEMPKGRKPIKTFHRWDNQRILAYQFIKKEIDVGKQAYIVFPLIEESEKFNYEDLLNGYEQVKDFFSPDGSLISLIHGKMNKKQKDTNMNRFVEGTTKIMVATTVIEVGVNVPNASVMLIESAEKFGLSQLHQLRGRVGRSVDQSYCILLTGYQLSQEAKQRIQIMCESNDGFKIAEKDLELRGPGNIQGTRQSGDLPFKLIDLALDKNIIFTSKQIVEKTINEDSNLSAEKNKVLLDYISLNHNNLQSWINIG